MGLYFVIALVDSMGIYDLLPYFAIYVITLIHDCDDITW